MDHASLDTAADAGSSATEAPWSTPRTVYSTLFMLVLRASAFQLDVAIVPHLAASLKADLHLRDATLGLLFDLSFSLLCSLVGLPSAYFIDIATAGAGFSR